MKEIHFLEDTRGISGSLHYVRDKQKNEVDFAVVRDRRLHALIEVKTSKTEISMGLKSFQAKLKPEVARQAVLHFEDIPFKNREGIEIVSLPSFLEQLAT